MISGKKDENNRRNNRENHRRKPGADFLTSPFPAKPRLFRTSARGLFAVPANTQVPARRPRPRSSRSAFGGLK